MSAAVQNVSTPSAANKKPKNQPPPLKPVPREDSIDTLDLHISDNGTLIVDIQGNQVTVRSWGATNEDSSTVVADGAPLLTGRILYEHLRQGHIVGAGAQAKVRKVKHTQSNVMYALKIITLGKQVTKRTIQQEISRVRTGMRHPNVVTSEEAYYVDGCLKILMEYMDWGTLAELISDVGALPEEILSCILRQILLGLKNLHDNTVIHRDLKPSNLLLNSHGLVKISDFGVSTFLNTIAPYANTLVGSTAYMSPERIRAEAYDTQADIWSVGLIAAQCALGVFPFFTDATDGDSPNGNPFARKLNLFDLTTLIAEYKAVIDFDMLQGLMRTHCSKDLNLSADFTDFVAQCMRQQAADRPTCNGLLKHPFIERYSQSHGCAELKAWIRKLGLPAMREKRQAQSRNGQRGYHVHNGPSNGPSGNTPPGGMSSAGLNPNGTQLDSGTYFSSPSTTASISPEVLRQEQFTSISGSSMGSMSGQFE